MAELSRAAVVPFPVQPPLPDRSEAMQDPENNPTDTPGDEEELYESLCERFKEGKEQSEDWRSDAVEDYDFSAGRQYSAEDRQVAEKNKRPMITYDRVGRNVAAVCGLEVNNRMEAAAYPREPGDVQKSEIGSSLLAWVDDTVQAPDEDSESFRDMVICGIGVTDTNMNYLHYADGMPETLRCSPLITYWDPHAKRRNLIDRSWDALAKTMPVEEAKRICRGHDEVMLHAGWAGIDDDLSNIGITVQDRGYDRGTRGKDKGRKRVTLIEMQWREIKPVFLVEDQETGSQRELSIELGERLVGALPGRFKGTERPGYVYWRAILGGMILKKSKLDAQKQFTRKFMTGYRDETTGQWYGLVKAMKDPQRAANALFSQSVAMMKSGTKNGWAFERTAVKDVRNFERNQARNGVNLVFEDGALSGNRAQPLVPSPPPSHTHELLGMSLDQVQQSVGIPLEAVAMATGQGAGQTALLESERRKAGMNILAHFFASKRSHLTDRSKLVLRYVHEFMRDGRLVKVVSEGQEQNIQLWLDDQDITLYDIIVDDSPTSPDARERIWLVIKELMTIVPPTPEVLAKVMPYIPHFPSALAAEFSKLIEESPEAQAEKERQKQLMERAQEAEVAKTEGQAEKEASAAQLNIAKVQEMGGRLELDASEQARETSLAIAAPGAIPVREVM